MSSANPMANGLLTISSSAAFTPLLRGRSRSRMFPSTETDAPILSIIAFANRTDVICIVFAARFELSAKLYDQRFKMKRQRRTAVNASMNAGKGLKMIIGVRSNTRAAILRQRSDAKYRVPSRISKPDRDILLPRCPSFSCIDLSPCRIDQVLIQVATITIMSAAIAHARVVVGKLF